MTNHPNRSRKKIRYEGRDVDIDALLRASRQTLLWLADMTTEDFERGADRECRRALAVALGYDPADFSL